MAKRGGFPGMGGGANMQQLMRQAQKMQQDMEQAQKELTEATVEATTGGGMVTCIATGEHKIQSIKINPEAVDPDDVEMLEDMVVAAVNEAMRLVDDMTQQKMGRFTGGMNIPGF